MYSRALKAKEKQTEKQLKYFTLAYKKANSL